MIDLKQIYDKDEYQSMRAFYYCKNIEDKPRVYELITDSYWAYCYCIEVKDRPEVRNNITSYNHKSLYYLWDLTYSPP